MMNCKRITLAAAIFPGRAQDIESPGNHRTPNRLPGSRMKLNAHASFAARARGISRAALWVLPLLFVALLLSAATAARAESANTDYKRGQDAEARQDFDAAYTWFQKAATRSPQDIRYRTAFARIRTSVSTMHMTKGRRLADAGDASGALAEFLHAQETDSSNEAAQQEIAKLRRQQGEAPKPGEIAVPQPTGDESEIASIASPIDLTLSTNEPLTLHMNEDSKVVYQSIGKAAGINVLFDPDYTSKRIQVDLNGVNLRDALRIVGALSNTFWKPVTSNTIFVAQNSRVKRTELDVQAVQTFYLSNAWQQNDLNDVQTALRNVLPNAKVYGVASQNAIVMRATPDELLLAQKLINDLDKPRSEVVVDFGVLEVSHNWERNLGISWPSSIGVALQNPTSTSSSSSSSSTTTTTASSAAALTLSTLAHLNSNNFAVTVGSATLKLLLSDNQTQILQDPRIRATDGQKATLTVGSKIPIATGSYQTGAATALVSSLVNTQFQYIDVGVKIEMTPTVHYGGDVTLKVHIEISSQSGSVTISGVTEPILSQRVADQVIRLREGEASILGGIQNSQNDSGWAGIPGLSSIPILKYLFGSRDRSNSDDEIVFVVVPHVVRGPDLDEQNLRSIDTGAGQSIDLRHVSAPAVLAAPTPKPTAPAPAAASAPAAAMQALDQLHASAAQIGAPQAATTAPAAPAPPAPVPAANTPAAPQNIPATAPASAASGLIFTLDLPAGPVQAGSSFQVPIKLAGGADIASVPLQLKYDPSKLALVNVLGGDFLSKDGQAVALIHRDDGPGNVTIVASRPPGTNGIAGPGVVCTITFEAKAPGASNIEMTRAGIMTSGQQQVQATPAMGSVVVK